jgi:hypothetical protein
MLVWIIQIAISSLILIFLVHHLINFLTSTLTVPKIKDLVDIPTKKYESMFNVISQDNLNNSYTNIDLLPSVDDSSSMKMELKNFLKKQLNNAEDNIIGYNNDSNILHNTY